VITFILYFEYHLAGRYIDIIIRLDDITVLNIWCYHLAGRYINVILGDNFSFTFCAIVKIELLRVTCTDRFVQAVLYRQTFTGWPVPAVLFWQSCPGCPVLTALPWLSGPDNSVSVFLYRVPIISLSQMSCPYCNVMTVLSFQFCQGWPAWLYWQADLSCPQSSPVVTSWLPATVVLSRLSCPSCPVFLSCAGHHVSSVMSRHYLSSRPLQTGLSGCPLPDALSQLSYHGCPATMVMSRLTCPKCSVLACPGRPEVSFLPWLSWNCSFVLIILSMLTCSDRAELFQLSCPRFPVLAVMSLLLCSRSSVLPVKYKQHCPEMMPKSAQWIWFLYGKRKTKKERCETGVP
jgi:hypothetical protein